MPCPGNRPFTEQSAHSQVKSGRWGPEPGTASGAEGSDSMEQVRSKRRRWAPVAGSLAVSGLGCVLVAMLPHFVGASWPAIGGTLVRVPAVVLAGLLALWFVGLLVHVPVLTAAMPGLKAHQALALNLSGSAVSNVLPMGGPAGMGLGYAMTHSWGFRSDRFASYTVATNLWNALGKFSSGLAILAVAAVLGVGLPSGLGSIVISASVFMAVAVGLATAAFRSERATERAGGRLDAISARLKRAAPSQVCTTWMVSSRRELVSTVRSGWRRMTVGVLTYLFLQCVLMYACLDAVGAGATVAVVAVAFAIERLISLAPITPGAAGVAELGTVAALHGFGIDPVVAAAGILLYRILVFAIEIPAGGLIALVWLRGQQKLGITGWPKLPALPRPAILPGQEAAT